jgi:hypothetical protein
MPPSRMLRRVGLTRTDVSDEIVASIYRVQIISELGTMLTVTSRLVHLIISALKMDAIYSSVTLVLTRATWRHIPEDGILQSHCRENLKSYIALTGWTL